MLAVELEQISAKDRDDIDRRVDPHLATSALSTEQTASNFSALHRRHFSQLEWSGPTKMRTAGVEVFGRKPDYDNNSDLIVRVTATELRKKLAQYHYEDGHSDEIRI